MKQKDLHPFEGMNGSDFSFSAAFFVSKLYASLHLFAINIGPEYIAILHICSLVQKL
jgi:hypothetical protein